MLELIERPDDIHLIFWRPQMPGIETSKGVQVGDQLVLRTNAESLGVTIDEILPNDKCKVRIDFATRLAGASTSWGAWRHKTVPVMQHRPSLFCYAQAPLVQSL